MKENGSSLEIGADLMAVLLFTFIILTSVMKPDNPVKESELRRIQRTVDSLQTEIRFLSNVDLAASGHGQALAETREVINIVVARDSYGLEYRGEKISFRNEGNLKRHLLGLTKGFPTPRSVTIYADRSTKFEKIVSVFDIVREVFRNTKVNIAVMSNQNE